MPTPPNAIPSLFYEYLLSHLLMAVTSIAVALTLVKLLATNRAPQSLIAWILALVFMPAVAVPFFLLLGSRKFPRSAKRTMGLLAPDQPYADSHPIARAMRRVGAAPVRENNLLELLGGAEVAYHRLLELIDTAQRSISVNMFIVGDDEVGWTVLQRLAARARAGVKVRCVLDAVGSRKVMRRARRMLAAEGGEVRSFMPLIHAPLRGRTNLRCHRKLVVCDDMQVFVGGMNLALEYMGPAPWPGRFVDLAAVATGDIALDASAVFESDWAFCAGQNPPAHWSLPRTNEHHASGVMQLVPSGPDMREDTFYNGLLTALATAQERIALVTPYYVPDDVVQRSLQIAARRGVRTQLIMPLRSNHPLADFARRGLLRELANAGVELFFYPDAMVHAKAMVVDDGFAYIGSPNVDMRSLFLNYEDALFLYDPAHVQLVAAWIDTLLAGCTRTAPKYKRELWLFEQLARIVAPEL